MPIVKETVWKVVPICGYQKLDVRREDLLNDGDFRKCDTYRGGGGYDQFPAICEKRLGKRLHHQLVVQLYGCNLDCPYCYVTRTGVWSPWKPYTTNELLQAFADSGQEVFHLMGGAPALYLEQWPEIIERLPEGAVFHSDFLLTEKPYPVPLLRRIAAEKNCLFAVDIKGVTREDYERNTRTKFKEVFFWENLANLVWTKVPFYITFTNPDLAAYDGFVRKLTRELGDSVMEDAFTIPLIEYEAGPFVDIQPVRS